jgi:ketopantoate reductase
VELSREVAAIAPHLGVELDDYPGVAVKTVCVLPFDTAVESVKARGRAMRDKGMTGVRISMLQDLERGKRTEAEQVIGHVIRLAAQHKVAVPKLDLLYRIIRGIEVSRPASDARS